MRGQAEVVSSVILIALVLMSIAVAYAWGIPLISKAGDSSRIQYVQGIFERAGESINRVARDGGQASISVRSEGGTFRIVKDQIGEYVIVYTISSRAQFFAAEERPLTDTSSPYKREEAWANSSTGLSGCFPELSICGSCCEPVNFSSAYELRPPLEEADNSYFCDYDGHAYLCIHNGAFTNFTEGDEIMDSGYTVSLLEMGQGLIGLEGRYTTSIGMVGVNKPAVVLAASVQRGGEFQTTLKLKTRGMLDPGSNELIEIKLNPIAGTSTVSEGNFVFSARKAGETLRTEPETGRLVRAILIEVGFTR